MKRYIFFLFFFLLSGFMSSAQQDEREDRVKDAIEANPDKEFVIFKYDMKEMIAKPIWRTTQQAFEQADTLGADFILIHMNTYGGQVNFADSIRTKILQSDIPVMVFIDNNAASAGALISIATDRIYMRSGANIGAATVVDQSGEVVADKFQSYMRSTMRSTAEAKGRDPKIAEAMVDPSIEIEGIIEEGKVLTFTTSEAMKHGYAEGTAETIDEVIATAGIENFQIIEQKLTATDRIINFLISPLVSGILIMLILGGIYFELQTPGIGFPIIASLLGAVLYFAPLYLEGLADNWELILFVVGLALLAVEIFAIPGFGVAGILGVVFMISGLAFAMVGNDGPDFSGVPTGEIGRAFLIVIIAFFLSVSTSIYIGAKLLLNKGKIGNTLALNTIQDTTQGFTSSNVQMKSLVGQTGKALTMMRPSGKVEIDDDIYDATALNGFVDKGDQVKVMKYETSQIFVIKA